MYYVAKRELFDLHPLLGWLLGALGAFPVSRGSGDQDMIATAKQLLARGELVLIFPEGTRTRPGPLGRPRRGVGRLALESGAPVVPVAIFGTEAIRRGWRLRPHKVRVRAGRPLLFPARRRLHSGRRRRGHRSRLGVRATAVGVAGWTCGNRTRARAPGNRARRLSWAVPGR